MPRGYPTPKTQEKFPQNPWISNWVVSTSFQAIRVSAVGADLGHHHCTRAVQGGAPPPDDHRCEISRPAAVGRAWIGPTNTAAAATLGHRILPSSGHFRPTHTSLPPFLNPQNSFTWSFSPDSSPFKRYDKNKFGQLLDRVFRPPHQPMDQGKGIDVFLVSWAFH